MSTAILRLFAAACLAALHLAAAAADPATRDLQALRVETLSERGPPLIFIPGLSSGAWSWRPIAERYAASRAVYIVTVAGFDGVPPRPDTSFATIEASLAALIDAERLDKPVLVGHSLGATLAIHFAEAHSDRIAGVVAVDGLPVFPRTERMSGEQRGPMADAAAARVPRDAAAYAASQEAYMASFGGTLDAATGQELARLSGRSDPTTVATLLREDLAADFRDGLPRIRVPVLLVSPYNAADFGNGPQAFSEQAKTDYYRGLMAGTPELEVVSVSPARHFVQFDQPERVRQLIDSLLARSAGR